MDLTMSLNNQIIDSIPVNPLRMKNPAYIHHLQMELEVRNEEILDLTRERPEFFIENVPSEGGYKSKLPS